MVRSTIAEMTEPTFQREKPSDSRFSTCSHERFAVCICERISSETKIPFEELFHHEHLLEYIEAIEASNQCDISIESRPLFIDALMKSYNRENGLYGMMTGIPVSEETLETQRRFAVAKFDRLSKIKCRKDYERHIASMDLPNFIDC